MVQLASTNGAVGQYIVWACCLQYVL